MGCSLIVSMAKPSKSSFPKSAYTADGYARQAGSVPSHRVQASVEEWHADSKYDVPKDIMLKFPQVIVKGMPTETTVEGFSRYVEQELSPSPKIVGIKLGPKYSDSAVVFIYCAVLATADPDSIRTSLLLSTDPASCSIEGVASLTDSLPQSLCVAEESRD